VHESNVGGPQLRQSFTDQVAGIRVLEQQAQQLFADLAIGSSDEVLTSLFRATAAGTGVRLARLDRLLRTSGIADKTGVASVSDDDRLETPALLIEESDAGDRNVDDVLLGSACRSLRNQIAAYESACTAARQLVDHEALDILLQCLDEKLATNAVLFSLRTQRTRLVRAV